MKVARPCQGRIHFMVYYYALFSCLFFFIQERESRQESAASQPTSSSRSPIVITSEDNDKMSRLDAATSQGHADISQSGLSDRKSPNVGMYQVEPISPAGQSSWHTRVTVGGSSIQSKSLKQNANRINFWSIVIDWIISTKQKLVCFMLSCVTACMDLWVIKLTNQVSPSSGFRVPHCLSTHWLLFAHYISSHYISSHQQ